MRFLLNRMRAWRRNRDLAITAARMRTTEEMRVMVRDALKGGL